MVWIGLEREKPGKLKLNRSLWKILLFEDFWLFEETIVRIEKKKKQMLVSCDRQPGLHNHGASR